MASVCEWLAWGCGLVWVQVRKSVCVSVCGGNQRREGGESRLDLETWGGEMELNCKRQVWKGCLDRIRRCNERPWRFLECNRREDDL